VRLVRERNGLERFVRSTAVAGVEEMIQKSISIQLLIQLLNSKENNKENSIWS